FQDMIRRHVSPLLRARLGRFPAAVLVGPRQCGKTTLARSFGGAYFDLEQESDRLRLDVEWEDLVRGRRLVALDEAQAYPAVFPRLRGAIDADRRRNGRFLILGSITPALMREVSESLAGRLAVVELTPLCLPEVGSRRSGRLHRFGGFPDGGVLRPRDYPSWQASYVALMTQRDLPAWGLPARPATTERLLRMIAASHGAVLNATNLGQSLGVSYHTVQSYLDYLEGAFLVRRLPPFEANLRKRLVKSPRIYIRDTGLLHALLGLAPREDLLDRPWAGASWEGFVIEQILAYRRGRGDDLDAFFFRTHDGHEADLVLASGKSLEVVEIKMTSVPTEGDLARVTGVADLLGADRMTLISRTSRPAFSRRRWSSNLETYLARC
ncbi:MAG: ATP-binding protein, partial [candidate division NC10 bacterium]|nr:ATP-binding protein [candidate division NC10 bacterium]